MLFLAVTASTPNGFLEFVFIAFLPFVLFICSFETGSRFVALPVLELTV